MAQIPEESRKKLTLQPIKTLVIKPSEDLSKLAARFYDDMPWAIRVLLGFTGINRQSDSSIVSYLLFEKSYTSALIDLGYKDAMEQMNELKAFFDLN